MLPVALEELDEEDAEVGVRLGGVDPRVQLQEAHQQEDEGVRGEAASEHLEIDKRLDGKLTEIFIEISILMKVYWVT